MDEEITINGVTYVRKDSVKGNAYEFKEGCHYFCYHSSYPDAILMKLKKNFPGKNSFFVGKKGYCGKVCLEVNVNDITVNFLKKLLFVPDIFEIIEDEAKFREMVKLEMERPDLY